MILKRLLLVTLIFGLTLFSAVCHPFDLTLNNVPTSIFFSPEGGCTEAIVNGINNAQSEVLVLAYFFHQLQ
jgi:hypothetical protein